MYLNSCIAAVNHTTK